MGINAFVLGKIIFCLAVIMLVLGYVLGKRKTETPKITAFVAVLTSFFPPLALFLLVVLVCKNDVVNNQTECP